MFSRGILGRGDSLRSALTLLSLSSPLPPLLGPTRVVLNLTDRCNFSCSMCKFHSSLGRASDRLPGDFVDLAVAARVVEGAARMGARLIALAGQGEPMLHPNFAEIVRLITSHGLKSESFTNGSLLSAKRIEEIVDAGLDTLAVSLVAASPESHSRTHPGLKPDTFHRIVDSVAALQELKSQAGSSLPRLSLRFIALQGSHLEVDKMLDLAIRLRADSMHLGAMRHRSVGDIGNLALTELEEKNAVDRLRELAPRAAQAQVKLNIEEMSAFHQFGPISSEFPCYTGWFVTQVLVDGSVKFCPGSPWIMGNVRERPLEEIWFDRRYTALRRVVRSASNRARMAGLDCDRCCHFYLNWRVTRRLAKFGLAPNMTIPLSSRTTSLAVEREVIEQGKDKSGKTLTRV